MKNKKYLWFMLVPAIVAILVFTPGKSNPQFPNFAEIELPNKVLTQEDFIEDFEVFYNTLDKYYPFFEVNKELHQYDWLANKDHYLQQVKTATTSQQFRTVIEKALADLNHPQNSLLDESVGYQVYVDYRNDLDSKDWRYQMVEIFHKPATIKRYEISNSLIQYYLESREETKPQLPDQSIEVKDLNEAKLAYIKLPQMFNYNQIQPHSDILKPFLASIKDYSVLVLDLRGNKGGDVRFWQEWFLPKILAETQRHLIYNYMVHGPLTEQALIQGEYQAFKDDNNNRYLSKFDFRNQKDIAVFPSADSIKFQGKIYLVIDKEVAAEAELMSIFMKSTKTATLIGEKTAGFGITSEPLLFDLPNTGYVISIAKSLGTNHIGEINELVTTTPDIEINLEKEDVLEAILKLEGLAK